MPGALIPALFMFAALALVGSNSPSGDDFVPGSPTSEVGTTVNGETVTLDQVLSRAGRPGSSAVSDDPGGDPQQADEIPPGCDTAFALANPEKTCGVAAKNVPGEPDVTVTDLAVFRPSTPALTGDPIGYGLMNAPANVIATAEEQTVGGELFNRPVQVRFVPVQFLFDYGDGATRVSDTGGATWEALGVPQFTPTATTHPYRERGTYTVSVTVAYAPSVDFGSGWRPVAGTVSATSGGYGIQIVESRTALVEHDCLEDPSGVGCPTG